MRKVFFALACIVTLTAISCTTDTTTETDELYEQGTDKDEYVPPPNG